MKKKIILICNTLLLLLFSCASKTPKSDAGFDAIIDYSKKVYLKNGWGLEAIGGSFYDDKFKLNLGYTIYEQKRTVPEVRKMMVETAEDFMIYLNQNEKIRPFVCTYPLTIKNFEISFMFLDKERHFMHEGFIATARLAHGKIYYNIKKDDQPGSRLEDLFQEPYAEALRIVNLENEQRNTTNKFFQNK